MQEYVADKQVGKRMCRQRRRGMGNRPNYNTFPVAREFFPLLIHRISTDFIKIWYANSEIDTISCMRYTIKAHNAWKAPIDRGG